MLDPSCDGPFAALASAVITHNDAAPTTRRTTTLCGPRR